MQVFLYNVHKTVVAVDRLKEMQRCTCVGTVQQWCIHLSLTIKKLGYCSLQHQDETVTRICSLFSNWICHPIGPTCSFSVFHCWLAGRKGILPVKNWVVGCWHGYLSGARCRLVCFSKIQIGFTFLVPAHPGSPGKRAIKRACVCSVYIGTWTVFL